MRGWMIVAACTLPFAALAQPDSTASSTPAAAPGDTAASAPAASRWRLRSQLRRRDRASVRRPVLWLATSNQRSVRRYRRKADAG